ncbi:MAG: haloacid dehalogenase-like hydrolase [Chloroflexaceae bacterium]|nr:haloacid dehalogenase-like hydrolase [Chloroflexaceae bacterium]
MRLILWDIDGTLLYSGGVAGEAMRAAMSHVYGRPNSNDRREYAGKTDQQIIRETFPERDPADITALLPTFADAYMQELTARRAEMAARGRVLPGVPAALQYFQHAPDFHQSVLTGNMQAVAELKLTLTDLRDFIDMRTGAYGSDHHQRVELPRYALARAHQYLTPAMSGQDLVIVGDTPNDIACGKAHGARTVAVATGPFSVADLALSDLAATVQAIVG